MFRLARDKRIPYILFENVKGLLNHDAGRTFQIILGVLDAMGYDSQWELLDSQNFGVPQHRERIFLVANLRGHPRPKVFPIGRTEQCDDEPIQSEEGIQVAQWRRGYFRTYRSNGVPTLTANMGLGGNNVPYVTGRVPRDVDVFPTLDGHYWKGIQNNQGRGAVRSIVRPVLDVNRLSKGLNGRMIKDDNDPMYTITAQDRHGVYLDDGEKSRIRKLTPLECERLQGLPDGWTEFYADGKKVSDSERYERCGRTITIQVVEAIGRRLYDFW
jgi:DNA (cytosine-5)-methyltransferase 1